jgi:hypothetical protein
MRLALTFFRDDNLNQVKGNDEVLRYGGLKAFYHVMPAGYTKRREAVLSASRLPGVYYSA